MLVKTAGDIEGHLQVIWQAAAATQEWLASQNGDPLAVIRRMKFDPIGQHPVNGHPLNLIEQINQTWTYMAALIATRQLLALHPDSGGFCLAPGAHASQALDVMSVVEGMVGAETFAAVDPKNNQKLAGDLKKMANREEQHRYVFFISPLYPKTQRLLHLEREGVQVWSIEL
jgi:hypothetical protein